MTYCEKLCSVFGSKAPFPPPFLAFDANKKLYGNVCVCVDARIFTSLLMLPANLHMRICF